MSLTGVLTRAPFAPDMWNLETAVVAVSSGNTTANGSVTVSGTVTGAAMPMVAFESWLNNREQVNRLLLTGDVPLWDG